jgi:flagellar assembly factor FliW
MTTTATRSLCAQEADDMPGDIPVLEMVRPMVGFPEQRRFALARLDHDGLLCDLRSLDDPELSFVVVPPHLFFDDYAPEVDDELVADLGVENVEDLLLLTVVTLGDAPADATANLLAPVVVNHRTRRAAQVVLDDLDLPLRAPLTPARPAGV